MAKILRSYTDAGSHNDHSYDVFVQGFDGGPFQVDSIKIKGRPNKSPRPAADWATVEDAMAHGHQLARQLIDG